MATTEHTTIKSPCLCGDGAIAVTRSEPEHRYVRANQIGYAAELACALCEERYEIRDGEYDAYPWVVTRSEAERQRVASAKHAALEAEVMESDEVARLRSRIVAEVEGQPSMAAAHRVLKRFGLAFESVWTYRKRPYGGGEALRHADAGVLARIGSMVDMGQADAPVFKAWEMGLQRLADDVLKLEPAPVKTGAAWLRA